MKKFIITLIAAVIASYIAGYQTKKDNVIYIDVPRTLVDTTFVEKEVIVYKNIPAKYDTIFQIKRDTLYVYTAPAHLDTVLKSNDVLYGKLNVWHFVQPEDFFDLRFEPAPLPTVTITKFYEKKKSWYKNPVFTLSVGLTAGMIIKNQF